jgi:TPR repeat protein
MAAVSSENKWGCGCSTPNMETIQKAQDLVAKKQIDQAYQILEPLAKQGDPVAWKELGHIHVEQKGEILKAIDCYQKTLRSQICWPTRFNIAICYARLQQTEQNPEKRKDYEKLSFAYLKYVAQGCVKKNYDPTMGQFPQTGSPYSRLGNCYLHGKGTNRNLDEALKWYKEGEKINCPRSIYGLAELYQTRFDETKNETDRLELVKYLAKCWDLHFNSGFIFSMFMEYGKSTDQVTIHGKTGNLKNVLESLVKLSYTGPDGTKQTIEETVIQFNLDGQ